MESPPSLLESTFLHAQSIGRTTEQRLWQAGAYDWQTYLAKPDSEWPLTRAQRALLTPTILESQLRLDLEDFAWFAAILPNAEHWRAVPAFGHRVAFLDIETNGGLEPDDLTIVGVHDGRQLKQYVQGHNLPDFPASLDDTAVLVTFFGTGFDLPFLRRAFPDLDLHHRLHVDLCYLYKRLGMQGGLKQIETRMGIQRPQKTVGLSGWDAVRLWREYQRGRRASLDTLLAYNGDDVRNMATLLAEGYRRMAQQLRA